MTGLQGLRIRDERWNARSLCAGDLVRHFSPLAGYPRVICYTVEKDDHGQFSSMM